MAGSIVDTAERARQLLICCREIPSTEVNRIVNTQFTRFNLWASNIGVFADMHASLDYRLRTAITVRVTIEGNLENICGNLLSVLKGKSDLSDDELEEIYELSLSQIRHFGHTLLQKCTASDELRIKELLAVEDTISILHRLSLTIRKASDRGVLSKLPKLFDVDDGYEVLGERTVDSDNFKDPVKPSNFDISSLFRNYVRNVLTTRVFSSTESGVLDDDQAQYRDALLDRCVTTICTRRRQLVYFQGHQLKLSQRTTLKTKSLLGNTDSLPDLRLLQKTDLSLNLPDPAAVAPALSDTIVSDLRSVSFTLASSQSIASSTTSSNIDTTFDKGSPFEMPPPPAVEDGETEKMCPYCCLVLPIKTFSAQGRKTAWKRHIFKDLQPYMCLFPNCVLHGKCYSSFTDWQHHLHHPHYRNWECPLHVDQPYECSAPIHSFDTLSKFENHLNSHHPELDPVTIKAVTSKATHPAALPSQCFICLVEFSSTPSLEKHMARHFKSMLLLGLPWRNDIDNTSAIQSDQPTISLNFDDTSSISLDGDHEDISDVDDAAKEFSMKLSLVDSVPMSTSDRVYMSSTNVISQIDDSTSNRIAILETDQKSDFTGKELLNEKDQAKEWLPRPTDGSWDATYYDQIVKELVDSERKYVHDLENLHDLKDTLTQKGLVPNDIICSIFSNTDEILDFQKRFLNQVETIDSMPKVAQEWGLLFYSHEDAFTIYQPFIVNQRKATAIAHTVFEKIQQSNHHVAKDLNTLNMFLLKPVQRLVKYPVILTDLANNSEDTEVENNLKTACSAIQRIVRNIDTAVNLDLLNDAREELLARVDDWKSYDVETFGKLLLHGVYGLVNNMDGPEKPFEVYLFERIVLCLKEISSKKDKTPLSPKIKNGKGKLLLKGRIFMSNVTDIVSNRKLGAYSVQIWWISNSGVENFLIKFPSEELMSLWAATLEMQRQANTQNVPTNQASGANDFVWTREHTGALENPYLEKDKVGDDDSDPAPAPAESEFLPVTATSVVVFAVKVKVDGDYQNLVTLRVAPNIAYQSLVDQIDAKLTQVMTSSIGNGMLVLRYRDEDGDLVAIQNDDDIFIAFGEMQESIENIGSGGIKEFDLFCIEKGR